MPNHIHVLFEPAEGIAVQKCVQFIKGGISHRLRERIKMTIWQDGYHDHRVREDAEFVAFLGYIEQNPAKRGLQDWPWIWFASGAKAPLF
jgi:putative transposase